LGFKRVLFSGIFGIIIFIPLAYISFKYLGLTEQLTNNFIHGLPEFIEAIGTMILGPILGLIISMLFGVFLIGFFPLHWVLGNDPNNILLLIAVLLPWVLASVIASGLFSHTPRGGFNTSIGMGIGIFIIMIIPYIAISSLVPIIGKTLLDGIAQGITGMSYVLTVFTAVFEGALVGAICGAFIGSLKYKGEGGGSSSKSKSTGMTTILEPTFDSSKAETAAAAMDEFCTNCGAKLSSSEDEFCVNCGAKVR